MDATAYPAQPAPPAADRSAPQSEHGAPPRRPTPPVECTARLRAVAARVAAREAARVAARAADAAAAGLGAPDAPDGELDDGGREALGAACRAAREGGLHGEHVVLALKDVWRTLPEARPLARHEADAALARLVSACIAAFYQPATARAPARAQSRPQPAARAPGGPGARTGRDEASAVRHAP